MRWPWQRREAGADAGLGPGAGPVAARPPAPPTTAGPSPSGWAFHAPLQRTIATEMTLRGIGAGTGWTTTGHQPGFTGTMSHLVSPSSYSGVVDGDGRGLGDDTAGPVPPPITAPPAAVGGGWRRPPAPVTTDPGRLGSLTRATAAPGVPVLRYAIDSPAMPLAPDAATSASVSVSQEVADRVWSDEAAADVVPAAPAWSSPAPIGDAADGRGPGWASPDVADAGSTVVEIPLPAGRPVDLAPAPPVQRSEVSHRRLGLGAPLTSVDTPVRRGADRRPQDSGATTAPSSPAPSNPAGPAVAGSPAVSRAASSPVREPGTSEPAETNGAVAAVAGRASVTTPEGVGADGAGQRAGGAGPVGGRVRPAAVAASDEPVQRAAADGDVGGTAAAPGAASLLGDRHGGRATGVEAPAPSTSVQSAPAMPLPPGAATASHDPQGATAASPDHSEPPVAPAPVAPGIVVPAPTGSADAIISAEPSGPTSSTNDGASEAAVVQRATADPAAPSHPGAVTTEAGTTLGDGTVLEVGTDGADGDGDGDGGGGGGGGGGDGAGGGHSATVQRTAALLGDGSGDGDGDNRSDAGSDSPAAPVLTGGTPLPLAPSATHAAAGSAVAAAAGPAAPSPSPSETTAAAADPVTASDATPLNEAGTATAPGAGAPGAGSTSSRPALPTSGAGPAVQRATTVVDGEVATTGAHASSASVPGVSAAAGSVPVGDDGAVLSAVPHGTDAESGPAYRSETPALPVAREALGSTAGRDPVVARAATGDGGGSVASTRPPLGGPTTGASPSGSGQRSGLTSGGGVSVGPPVARPLPAQRSVRPGSLDPALGVPVGRAAAAATSRPAEPRSGAPRSAPPALPVAATSGTTPAAPSAGAVPVAQRMSTDTAPTVGAAPSDRQNRPATERSPADAADDVGGRSVEVATVGHGAQVSRLAETAAPPAEPQLRPAGTAPLTFAMPAQSADLAAGGAAADAPGGAGGAPGSAPGAAGGAVREPAASTGRTSAATGADEPAANAGRGAAASTGPRAPVVSRAVANGVRPLPWRTIGAPHQRVPLGTVGTRGERPATQRSVASTLPSTAPTALPTTAPTAASTTASTTTIRADGATAVLAGRGPTVRSADTLAGRGPGPVMTALDAAAPPVELPADVRYEAAWPPVATSVQRAFVVGQVDSSTPSRRRGLAGHRRRARMPLVPTVPEQADDVVAPPAEQGTESGEGGGMVIDDVQTEVVPPSPDATATAAPAAGPAAAMDATELAGLADALFQPLLRRVRHEILLDRERRGLRTDRR
ncbi:hypothetical protein V2J52_11570 [Georgenia sp. MJ173]|uniref:hypothetical protein n=1 Tax=Georgenia sunbinii TaxID=3117728 RepID=UPI002F26A1C7